jgi:hypothetical protein
MSDFPVSSAECSPEHRRPRRNRCGVLQHLQHRLQDRRSLEHALGDGPCRATPRPWTALYSSSSPELAHASSTTQRRTHEATGTPCQQVCRGFESNPGDPNAAEAVANGADRDTGLGASDQHAPVAFSSRRRREERPRCRHNGQVMSILGAVAARRRCLAWADARARAQSHSTAASTSTRPTSTSSPDHLTPELKQQLQNRRRDDTAQAVERFGLTTDRLDETDVATTKRPKPLAMSATTYRRGNNIRSTTTEPRHNNVRSTTTSSDNNIRSTDQSNTNNVRSTTQSNTNSERSGHAPSPRSAVEPLGGRSRAGWKPSPRIRPPGSATSSATGNPFRMKVEADGRPQPRQP